MIFCFFRFSQINVTLFSVQLDDYIWLFLSLHEAWNQERINFDATFLHCTLHGPLDSFVHWCFSAYLIVFAFFFFFRFEQVTIAALSIRCVDTDRRTRALDDCDRRVANYNSEVSRLMLSSYREPVVVPKRRAYILRKTHIRHYLRAFLKTSNMIRCVDLLWKRSLLFFLSLALAFLILWTVVRH